MLSIDIFHCLCAVKALFAFTRINVKRCRPFGSDGSLHAAQHYPGMAEGGSSIEISTDSSPAQPDHCRRNGSRSTVSPINK